jgi:deoxyribodipyrimidine photo-lyase
MGLLTKPAVHIFWFRRDLRLEDNTGLFHALCEGLPVLPLFIFDRNILDKLESRSDRRLAFIHQSLEQIQGQLSAFGASVEVFYGLPSEVFRQLLERFRIEKVFCNQDYEPYARQRDKEVNQVLLENGSILKTYKDQVIFEKEELVKKDQKPYTVFTPYSKCWKSLLSDSNLKEYPTQDFFSNFYKQSALQIPSLGSIGFLKVKEKFPPRQIALEKLTRYDEQRDFPALEGTTRMGVHLRFGTVSIRKLAGMAQGGSPAYLNELAWRDFYQAILWHFPRVGRGESFKKQYDLICWRNDESEFYKWCRGMTGYPMVDAGMRALNATGYMHNRLRMIVASFLTKHLLIDWRWGEAYFASLLLDFDLAANNGGWQWAAGSGCDAAPYFRVFNPSLQASRFDPDLEYTRRWIPELTEPAYPKPVVEHEFARRRALAAYSRALKK